MGGTKDSLLEVVAGQVNDDRVVDAFRRVPRAEFVPAGYEGQAYDDRPVPLPHRQTTSQPSLIARMVEAAIAGPAERVLEIGTGYGFQTALLASIVPEVVSVERHVDLADAARATLRNAGLNNVEVVVGDGWNGWVERAPYDAIVVSAAASRVPDALLEQLADRGRLVVPLTRGGSDDVVVITKDGDQLRERMITPARFVPLVEGRADA